ncbi:MAG: hypothetical protein ACRDDY_16395 [Clostridium sp.]|uniref:hypothetical protein n=1 Tax=Clostridium sp. TaxID=1506 RepID=UPI003EE74F40
MRIKRELIEYSKIDICPTKSKSMFKQINLENIFCIPSQKPDIEQIDKVWIDSTIIDYDIVKTPIGESLEGQRLTGNKVLVCGKINLKFQYTANEETQSVHTVHNCYPFCAYVVLDSDINTRSRIYPSILIEDVLAEQTDLRCIYTNTTLLVIVEKK